MFNANNLDWTKIFILPHVSTCNTYLRFFQYKTLYNILFLNKKLYLFGITKSPLYSYWNTLNETPIHLFCECNSTKYLWLQLNRHFHCDLTFPALTPQTVFLCLFRSSRPDAFCKKGVLRLQACNFIKKETLAQVLSCEFCEISKNIFSYRTLPVAASVYLMIL